MMETYITEFCSVHNLQDPRITPTDLFKTFIMFSMDKVLANTNSYQVTVKQEAQVNKLLKENNITSVDIDWFKAIKLTRPVTCNDCNKDTPSIYLECINCRNRRKNYLKDTLVKNQKDNSYYDCFFCENKISINADPLICQSCKTCYDPIPLPSEKDLYLMERFVELDKRREELKIIRNQILSIRSRRKG